MSFETIDPNQASERLSNSDWQYIDVRSEQEFDAGHPEGAFNIPIATLDDSGMMIPNQQFVEVIAKHFPKDSKLVLGCKMGGRSARGCEFLAQAGFGSLANMHGGFSGAPDMQGWKDRELPVAATPLEGRDYNSLRDA